MPLAYSVVKKGVAGNMRLNLVELTLDGSYAAGGYALTPASCGVGTINAVFPMVETTQAGTKGLVAAWDSATGKVKLFKTGSTTTVTTGSGELTELATNDTLIGTSSKVLCLVIGDNVTG